MGDFSPRLPPFFASLPSAPPLRPPPPSLARLRRHAGLRRPAAAAAPCAAPSSAASARRRLGAGRQRRSRRAPGVAPAHATTASPRLPPRSGPIYEARRPSRVSVCLLSRPWQHRGGQAALAKLRPGGGTWEHREAPQGRAAESGSVSGRAPRRAPPAVGAARP